MLLSKANILFNFLSFNTNRNIPNYIWDNILSILLEIQVNQNDFILNDSFI